MLALDGVGLDLFLAERACPAVGRPFRGYAGLAVLALDRLRLDLLLAERTLTR
jgi:hypothetical protein